MTVSEIMTRKVASVSPTVSFKEIWRIIFKNKVNSVPVVDKEMRLIGIITREELLERLYPDYQELFAFDDELPDLENMEQKLGDLARLTAAHLMRKRVIHAHEEAHIMRALSRMIIHHINQMPVVTEDGKLIGMVTKGDIFYSLFKKNIRRKK